MKKPSCLLLVLLLAGCNSSKVSSSVISSVPTSVEISLEEFQNVYLDNTKIQVLNDNYKYEVKDLKHVSLSDNFIEGVSVYDQFGLSSYVTIFHNTDFYYESNVYYFMRDENNNSYKMNQKVVEFGDSDEHIYYQEIIDHAQKTTDMVNFEESFLYSESYYKYIYEKGDAYQNHVYNSIRLYALYALVNHDFSTHKITKTANIINFELGWVSEEGIEVTTIGEMDTSTYNINYITKEYKKDGIYARDIETSHSLIHGDFEINYDTNKNYKEFTIE